jgi:hypothetical protein
MTKIQTEAGDATEAKLSATEDKALRAMFQEADVNHDGILDGSEISNFIAEKLGAGQEGDGGRGGMEREIGRKCVCVCVCVHVCMCACVPVRERERETRCSGMLSKHDHEHSYIFTPQATSCTGSVASSANMTTTAATQSTPRSSSSL